MDSIHLTIALSRTNESNDKCIFTILENLKYYIKDWKIHLKIIRKGSNICQNWWLKIPDYGKKLKNL